MKPRIEKKVAQEFAEFSGPRATDQRHFTRASMALVEILKKRKPSLSFEFFPPKTETASADLFEVIAELAPCNPSFVSVTYGAGGSTRALTHELVARIIRETAIPAIPHLTCVSHSEEEIATILENYAAAGVQAILALRGDPPKNQPDYDRSEDAFPYAVDLVRFIRNYHEKGGRSFGIGVAGFPEGHPETPNRLVEMDFLKAKVDAGADYICTQLFFDNAQVLDFRDRCALAGINVPIIAGIMPITTYAGMKRMADLAGGTNFPATLQRALLPHTDDPQALATAGIEFATSQCRDLLAEEIEGLHFYTLNKSKATLEIARGLNLA